MAIKTIAGKFKLALAAALSYLRMRAAGMPSGGINSAWRSLASQIALFLSRYTPQLIGRGRFNDVRWYRGRRYVRTSPLGMVAVPGTSKHTDGTALDLDTGSAAHGWMLRNGNRHGWFRTIASEPWHWEYDVKRDTVLAAIKRKAAAKANARAKVKQIQGILGVYRDGDAGPITNRAYNRATRTQVRKIQAVLGVTRDGIAGPKTDTAWELLKHAAN